MLHSHAACVCCMPTLFKFMLNVHHGARTCGMNLLHEHKPSVNLSIFRFLFPFATSLCFAWIPFSLLFLCFVLLGYFLFQIRNWLFRFKVKQVETNPSVLFPGKKILL
jgi:hypothetical protein